jgi:hypothetical protein
MSWQDDLKNIPFEITTGDNKVWHPLLIPNYEKDVEYNGTQYDFIGRVGSLFARRLPRGRSYPLEFAFKGENNIKVANAFEMSARNTNSWNIVHPFYGKLLVQPLSLKAVSSGLDCTIIQCQVVETIVANPPNETPAKADKVEQDRQNAKDAALIALTPLTGTIPVKNTQYALKVTQNIATRVSTLSKLESEYKSYQTYYKNALNELNNATGITSGYLTYMQKLITLPSTVASDIGTRFALLEDTAEYLIENLTGIATVGYFEKLFYNLMGQTVICAMSTAVTTQNDGDFLTKSDVVLYVEKLKESYETYLENLYNLEDLNFTPDHDMMFATHTLVCETVAYLYQIMFSAKQERIYYPPRDTNLIVLAHRLYGIASEDNISTLKTTNKIGLSEILNIKKDRPIKYYV